ncbi:hypothetical protein G5714_024735 [Onychostoma macrolepis]|uniref:Uncharacterized protein n=1 Tax=Onychostoma macrolepis TaxID=369639 RepID=A0A7J6BIR2_9TELE|nr:hypothetical protein G5714_024735 [Onychostoma macrolepis]
MNAWPPQASYPCGNFSDTSCLKPKKPEGSTPALPFDRCTAQSNSPPATVPGQVAPGTTWAPGLTQKREPAGARLPASPVLSRLLGAAEAPLEAARPGTPPGGGESTETEVPAGRSWGDREKGPAPVQSRRPRAAHPRRPARRWRRGHPDTPQPGATPHPGPRGLPERGHRHGREGGKRRERGRRGPGAARRRREREGAPRGGRSPSRGSGPAPLRTSARPTQPLEPILIPKLRI